MACLDTLVQSLRKGEKTPRSFAVATVFKLGHRSKRAVRTKFFVLILSTALVMLYLVSNSRGLGRDDALYIKYDDALQMSSTGLSQSSVTTEKINTILQQLNQTREEATFPAYLVGDYLLLNPNICTDTPRVHVIIIVHTATWHFTRRLRIRQTFANSSLFLPFQIRTAFLLGKDRDAETQRKMVLEHAQYKDTIMGDFYDDYHNLTLKGTMGFHWISEYCPNSDIVLKIDDDVIIDMRKLLEIYTDYMKGKQKSMFCLVWTKSYVLRTGKWKLPPNIFQNMKFYPYHYCNGFATLMSSDLAIPLYEAAKVTPFFWIDDIYLYGMLPEVAGGVTFHDFNRKHHISWTARKFYTCLNELGEDCKMFSALIKKPRNFDKIWEKIQAVRKIGHTQNGSSLGSFRNSEIKLYKYKVFTANSVKR